MFSHVHHVPSVSMNPKSQVAQQPPTELDEAFVALTGPDFTTSFTKRGRINIYIIYTIIYIIIYVYVHVYVYDTVYQYHRFSMA